MEQLDVFLAKRRWYAFTEGFISTYFCSDEKALLGLFCRNTRKIVVLDIQDQLGAMSPDVFEDMYFSKMRKKEAYRIGTEVGQQLRGMDLTKLGYE